MSKINYIGLLQAIIRAIFISIVFLKNSTKTAFFYIKEKIASSKQVYVADPEEHYKKDINFYKTMTDANDNIDPTLYDFTLKKTLFVDENNPTEKQWRSRILFENTYRGNIIMYYDAFRMTFSYYSDEQIVPYKALCLAAIKYVVKFRCRNFFIDMETFPDNPMIEVLRKEDDSLKTKVKMNQGPNQPVFARLKNYTSNDKQQNKPKHLFSNKFVRIGKMCEFNILQKPPNKKIEAVNSLLFSDKPMSSITDFFDDIDISENTEHTNPFSTDQPKMTSYQLFKMMKQKEAPII